MVAFDLGHHAVSVLLAILDDHIALVTAVMLVNLNAFVVMVVIMIVTFSETVTLVIPFMDDLVGPGRSGTNKLISVTASPVDVLVDNVALSANRSPSPRYRSPSTRTSSTSTSSWSCE